MTIVMNDSRLRSIADAARFLKGSAFLKLKGISRKEVYAWMSGILEKFRYFRLRKKEKAIVKNYIMRMTGFSDAQATRLIARKRTNGRIEARTGSCHSFPRTYTKQDVELLAETDNLHERLSGPATKKLFQRA